MRDVILYIAKSLDGYIEDESGGVDWLGGGGTDPDNPGSYPRFIKTIDTVIIGYRIYHQIVTELSQGSWFYHGKTSYILTHKEETSTDEIIFTHENIESLITRLKRQDGKDIWICGGADIANQVIELDLIDRYHITVIPTILGGGVRLFEKHVQTHLLKLISTEEYNGMVDLIYERRG